MLTRLGNVLYWAGCIWAAGMIGLGALILSTHEYGRERSIFLIILFFGFLALVAWAIGWACRYVLTGRKDVW